MGFVYEKAPRILSLIDTSDDHAKRRQIGRMDKQIRMDIYSHVQHRPF